MIPVLAATALLLQQEGILSHDIAIPNNPRIQVRVRDTRLDPPKLSPKIFDGERWQFDWITWGFGDMGSANGKQLRVRVYSQERRSKGDAAPMVARMAMQLWDKTFTRLRINHPIEAYEGLVDLFLCFGAPKGEKAGGEQLMDWEDVPGQLRRRQANTIYIYDLSSFKDPVEMAREIAHEYGHAVLPGVSGFKQPEPWSNGFLGEKLFLKWIRDDMAAGRLGPEDAMGASQAGLDAWVKQRVDPLVTTAATLGPAGWTVNEAKSGMDAFLGLALYAESTLPPGIFVKSLAYTSDAHRDQTAPVDYPEQIVQAASETENLTLAINPAFIGKKIWIPLGKGTCPAATILLRDKKTGWAQVVPASASLVIKNPAIG